MVRVGRLVVIGLVATFAGIRRVVVIPIVTDRTVIGNSDVCSGKWINRFVVEGGGCPSVFIVAGGTIHRELQGNVVGVRRLVVIVEVTAVARVGRIVVVAVVACRTIVGYDGMCPV